MELFIRFLWFAKNCIKGGKIILKVDQNLSDRKRREKPKKLPQQYFNYFQLCRKAQGHKGLYIREWPFLLGLIALLKMAFYDYPYKTNVAALKPLERT